MYKSLQIKFLFCSVLKQALTFQLLLLHKYSHVPNLYYVCLCSIVCSVVVI